MPGAKHPPRQQGGPHGFTQRLQPEVPGYTLRWGDTVTWGDAVTYRASQHAGEAWQALQRTTSEPVGEWEPATPQPCLPPRDASRSQHAVPSLGYLQGVLGSPLKPCGPCAGWEGDVRAVNAPTGAGGGWCGTTGPSPCPSPHPPTMSPLTGFPSGPASPLSPGRPWSKRQGWGQCQAGVWGQRQAGGQCSTHRGTIPALLARLPSLAPQATLTLQQGQKQGHRTGRDLPVPLRSC